MTSRTMIAFFSSAVCERFMSSCLRICMGFSLIYRPSACPVPANEAVPTSSFCGWVAWHRHVPGCTSVEAQRSQGRLSSQECKVPSNQLIHSLDGDDHKFLNYSPVGICTKYQFLTSKILRMLGKNLACFQNKTKFYLLSSKFYPSKIWMKVFDYGDTDN